MRLPLLVIVGLFALFLPDTLFAQGWGEVAGRVTEVGTGDALPGVTILVVGTDFGTATDEAGDYRFRIPAGRYALRVSTVGFVSQVDSVVVLRGQTTSFDVSLRADVIQMEGVTVEEETTPLEVGVHRITPKQIQDMPSPFKGYQALKAMPGVATNNEMSNQYSVRGGGFNENLIFINGFELYMPFRPRQGQQEGVGLFNPYLAEKITLYTGGFPARYGGKLSSALEIRYVSPDEEPLSGSAQLSMLDASVSARAARGRLGWSLGLRKAQARRFFSTQELKGNYQPDYLDLQGVLSYQLSSRHDLELLGIWADHTFNLDPRGRKTYFGIISADLSQPSDLRAVWINYDERSREEDGYRTGFLGLRLDSRLSKALRAEHDVAYFKTEETEFFNLIGSTVIYQVDPGSNPNGPNGKIPRGNALQEEAADNKVGVDTWTLQGRYVLVQPRHVPEVGWSLRQLRFDDQLQEKGIVQGNDVEGNLVRIVVDSLGDQAVFDAYQAGLYVQDALSVIPGSDQLTVTGGLRADYFSFNDEWTVSPRLSARYHATENLTLSGAWGIYYQHPTYRELRGAPLPGSTILGALNRDLRSQRSIQWVAGMESFLPHKRLYLRAEAYLKSLSQLISYTVENVRVEYSGKNDARGHVYGLDLQLRGEFVPGMESWVNYGFMMARESFLPTYQNTLNDGSIPRPTDQRHTFSLFIQDYVSTDPTWKLHMRALFGSGLPYTPPQPGERLGNNLITQVPGKRFSARYPEFRRIDLGATKHIVVTEKGRPIRLELTGELLNIFDMVNTVAYTWIPDGTGIWQRVPTRLTPRTFNVRMQLSF